MSKRFRNDGETSELFRLGSILLYLRLHGRYSGCPVQRLTCRCKPLFRSKRLPSSRAPVVCGPWPQAGEACRSRETVFQEASTSASSAAAGGSKASGDCMAASPIHFPGQPTGPPPKAGIPGGGVDSSVGDRTDKYSRDGEAGCAGMDNRPCRARTQPWIQPPGGGLFVCGRRAPAGELDARRPGCSFSRGRCAMATTAVIRRSHRHRSLPQSSWDLHAAASRIFSLRRRDELLTKVRSTQAHSGL
jgi:hypothetical protein